MESIYPVMSLNSLAKIYNGNSINKTVKQEKYTGLDSGWNFIATKDIGFDGKVDYENGVKIPFAEDQFKTAPADCVFVCSEGGSAGKKTAYITQEVCFGNKLYAIVNNNDLYFAKYIYYFTRSNLFYAQFQNLLNGIIGGVSSKKFGLIQIPVPPLPDQERIVTRIEELFSELDSGVETLKKTKAQLAVYRQAVLHEIFGKFDEFCKINEICSHIVDCPHSTPKWVNTGKLCLRTTNFRRGYLDLSEPNYVSEETFADRIKRLKPCEGDVLYSREGAILGIACMVPKDVELCLGQRMMLLRAKENNSPYFIMHWLNSPYVTNYIKTITGGSASPHVNVGDIKVQKIPKISLAEQKRAVAEIESRLSVCDSIEQTIDAALQEAEALRQSILKQAFEGGL